MSLFNFLLFLSTPYPIVDLIDFSCAYLFIRFIYSLFIRQTGDRVWRRAQSWPCRDQYHKISNCSQPSGRGKGAAEQLGYAGIEICTEIAHSKTGEMILPLPAGSLRSVAPRVAVMMNLNARGRPSAFEPRPRHSPARNSWANYIIPLIPSFSSASWGW